MSRELYCNICNKGFTSGYEMAMHFRSKEHKEKAHFGNVDSILDKFIKRFKELLNGYDESNNI